MPASSPKNGARQSPDNGAVPLSAGAPQPNASRRQRVAWLVWALLLVVSIAAVPVLNERASGTTSHPAGAAASRFGFRLDSAGDEIGVRFVHEGPTFDATL